MVAPWCHGAPGIAHARAHALQLDPAHAESPKITTRAALTTTIEGMQRLLAQPRADATLCHGLSGPAEISFTAGLRIDDPSFGSSATATDRVLLDRHSVDDDWPSGLACKGPNPSFSARPVSDSIFSVATIPGACRACYGSPDDRWKERAERGDSAGIPARNSVGSRSLLASRLNLRGGRARFPFLLERAEVDLQWRQRRNGRGGRVIVRIGRRFPIEPDLGESLADSAVTALQKLNEELAKFSGRLSVYLSSVHLFLAHFDQMQA